jgi:hypothetical protein
MEAMKIHNHLEKTLDKPISELFFQIWCSGRITQDNRFGLKYALLKDTLGEEDKAAIDRLLHAVRRGWLTLD